MCIFIYIYIIVTQIWFFGKLHYCTDEEFFQQQWSQAVHDAPGTAPVSPPLLTELAHVLQLAPLGAGILWHERRPKTGLCKSLYHSFPPFTKCSCMQIDKTWQNRKCAAFVHHLMLKSSLWKWCFGSSCGSRITSLQIRQRKDSCSTEPSLHTSQKSFHPPRQFSWSTTVVKTDKSQAENKRKAINLVIQWVIPKKTWSRAFSLAYFILVAEILTNPHGFFHEPTFSKAKHLIAGYPATVDPLRSPSAQHSWWTKDALGFGRWQRSKTAQSGGNCSAFAHWGPQCCSQARPPRDVKCSSSTLNVSWKQLRAQSTCFWGVLKWGSPSHHPLWWYVPF